MSWISRGFLWGILTKLRRVIKRKGGLLKYNRICQLQDMVVVCALVHLEFDGSCFTWSNMRQGVNNIQGRIDRCYGNQLWLERLAEARISHLPRPRLDHHLVLLHDLGRIYREKQPQFQMLVVWYRYQSFKPLVEETW